jgi:phage-related tail fiber protein
MPIFRGKNFVSAVSDYKDSVRVAVRSNINLSGTVSVVDGVTLSDKDRVLVAGQSSATQNGIYIWSSADSRLIRASDADSAFELSAGNRVYVEEGNTNAQTNWVLISTGVISPGISNIVFAKENKIGPVAQFGTFGSANKTLQIQLDETGQVSSINEIDISLDGGNF